MSIAKSKLALLQCLAVVATMLVAAPLPATERAVEEIVVTAQKRERTLQETPISLGVFDEDTLGAAGISNVEDLFYIAPSVNLQGSVSSAGRGMLVRGVGGGAFATGFESSVGTTIDGVATGPGGAALAEFWDIDRIEVLRGPQGTLFGKNTSAGAVNIVTNSATQNFEANASAEWNFEHEQYRLGGMVNLPITPDLAIRLAAFMHDRDKGVVKNIVRDETENIRQRWGIRFNTVYELEGFSADLTLSYDEQDDRCCVRTFNRILDESQSPLVNGFLRPQLNAFGVEANNANVINIADGTLSEKAETFHGALELNWELPGGHTIKSVTGYRSWDQQEFNDVDFLPLDIIDGAITKDLDLFSQEWQLLSPAGSALEYVAGVYYYTHEIKESTVFTGGTDVVGFDGLSVFDSVVDLENYAIFGHATYAFNENWSAFAGARLLHEKIDAAGQRGGNFFAFPGNFAPESASNSDTDWIGTLGVQYFASPRSMYYASISTGYKGSAIDTTIGSTLFTGGPELAVLAPETVVSYELGARTSVFDDQITLNATLFYSEFDDFQATAFSTEANSFVLRNAGELSTRGIEVDARGQLWPGSYFTFAAAYIDAQFDEFIGAPCQTPQRLAGTCVDAEGGQDLSGRRANQAPKWQFTITGEQRFTIAGMDGYVRGDYAWRDSNISDASLDPNTKIDAYGIANFKLSVAPAAQYELSLFVRNAFDKQHVSRRSNAPLFAGAYAGHPGDRRSWGVQVRFEH